MAKLNIFICDDEEARRESWKNRLDALRIKNARFEAIENAVLTKDLAILEKRRLASRNHSEWSTNHTIFDRADVLLVDYDLLRASSETYLTGENIAYLARCYSECGVIVVMNQGTGERVFDLTLTAQADSFADLNVGSSFIDAPALWGRLAADQMFSPWSWFDILDAVSKYRRRVDEISDVGLDMSVLAYFDLSEQVVGRLDRSATELIDDGGALPQATFRSVAQKSRLGLRSRDTVPDEQLVRIAAARVANWLERYVLPSQHVLVDAPHLLLRLPGLLRSDKNDLQGWNAAVGASPKAFKSQRIQHCKFRRRDWLSRPVWNWVALVRSVGSLQTEAIDVIGRFAFCEDASTFVEIGDAHEFVSDVPGPFARRHVLRPDLTKRGEGEVEYRPQVRFAL